MTTTNTPDSTQKAPPIDKIRFGDIHVSIWANRTDDGRVFYSTRIERRYKDANGKWRPSNTFSRDAIPVLIDLLNRASLRMAALDEQRTADPATGEIAA